MTQNINLETLTVSQGFSIVGDSGSGTGNSVSNAGDVNNDGIDDVIIGSSRASKSHVIFGKKGGSGNIDLSTDLSATDQGFSINGDNDGSGYSVSGAGDVNGDKISDVIITNENFINGGGGEAYVVYGANSPINSIDLSNLTNSRGFLISGNNAGKIGYSISDAGDINGDGWPDIIIGAPDASESYVLYGMSLASTIDLTNLAPTQGFVIMGEYNTGRSVSGAGDVNGDGFDDIVVGVSSNVYVIYGNSSISSPIYLTNLAPTQGFVIMGEHNTDRSVSGAGDINKDGYDDVITVGTYSNVVYLVYGTPTSNTVYLSNTNTQILSITGGYSYMSLSKAGDINNDGYDDILIGSAYTPPCESSYSKCTGAAYIIYGNSSLPSTISLSNLGVSGVSIYGETLGDFFGSSVSYIDDINRDSFDDIMVAGHENSGAVKSYVMYGNASFPATINVKDIPNGQAFTIIGEVTAVSGAGDVDGDGYDDILLGNPYADSSRGESYIIYGGSSLLSSINLESLSETQGVYILGANNGDNSGFSVSKAGDINGDGYADVFIGAPNVNLSAGAAYIIYGSPQLSSTINLANLTETGGVYITRSYASGISLCSSAGDVDGDGYSDIIVNANTHLGLGAYIIYGKAYPSNIKLASIDSTQGVFVYSTNGQVSSISDAGDVNEDGFGDIIIGISGIAYVVYGDRSLKDTNLDSLTQAQGISITTTTYYDLQVSNAGDVNRDGYADFIIGREDGYFDAGKSYVIYGGKSLENINIASLSLTQGFSIYGVSNCYVYGVSDAGDVNKDGYDDVILFSKGNCFDVYLVFGGKSKNDILLETLSSNDGFIILSGGDSKIASGAGDVNGDGYSDVILGASSANANDGNSGESWVVYGSASDESSTDTIISDWWNSLEFKIVFSLGTPLLSFIAGWIFREKIAFHILSNWGFDYELIYSDNKMPLPAAKVGFRLLKQKSTGVDKLVCKIKGKYMNVEIDNGNNKGISEGLYNTIIDKLKQPHQSEPFVFLQSEKNQIRDFLFSRSGFVNAGDLGCIKGTIYRLCMNSNYKRKHEEKYQYEIRVEDAERFSGINDDDIQREINSPMNPSISMTQLNKQSIKETKDLEKLDAVDSITSTNNRGCVVMSIDAMMDPEHVRLQNEAFERFGQALIDATKDLLMIKQGQVSREDNQAVAVYQDPAAPESIQFSSSDNLMISLLSARQIVEYLPLMKHVMQSSINYLGYNITLPEVLDNKAILTTTHLILGYTAAQYLPAESIMNGIFISTLSTASYSVRLMSVDYLKNQKLSEEPIEFAQQCASTIAAYTLPGMVNYALTKVILPDAKMSISTLDMLGSASFGVVQCYNNYKVVYGTETTDTTTDIVVPYIADAITLWSLRSYLNFDTSGTASLMMSIKNAMSVAATTYATHCVGNMFVDLLPQETKEEYLNPAFNFAYITINDVVNTCYQFSTDVSGYITEEVGLIMDYIGSINSREDA